MPGPILAVRSGKRAALVISVLYALLASLWIVLSDRLIGQLIRDSDRLTEFQTYKGWLFVAATALLLYVLLRFHAGIAQDPPESRPRSGRSRWRERPPFLVLAITAPIAGLLAYNYYSDASERYRLTGAAVLNLAEVTAADSEKFIADTRAILEQFAVRPQITALERKRCDPILLEIPRMLPRFANIVVVDRTGEVICTAVPQRSGQPTSVAALPWFRRLSQENRFVFGPPAVGFITGRWIVTLAQPLRDEQGAFIGAIVVPVDLARYEILTSRASLPPGAVITLIDSEGTIVARAPEAEKWVGRNLRGTGIVDEALAQQHGVSEALSASGIRRVIGVAPVAGSGWHAIAQVPSDVVYADARAALLRNAAVGVAVVLAVALFVSVLGSRIPAPEERSGALARGPDAVSGWPIRHQLLILALVVAVPLAALFAASLYSNFGHSEEMGFQSVGNIAAQAKRETERCLGDSKRRLELLARRPLVRAMDPARCDPIFGEIRQLFPEYANVALRDLEGRLVCGDLSQPGTAPASVSEFDWFREGRERAEFTAGNAFFGRVTGKWVSVLTYPVRDDRQRMQGLLVLPIDVAFFGRQVSQVAGLQGSTFGVVDREGAFIVHSPRPDLVGMKLRGKGIIDIVLRGGRGELRAAGIDDVERIYAYETVAGAGWHIYAGVPVDIVLGAARASAIQGVALGAIFLMVVAGFAFMVGRRIAVPLREIGQVTSEIAAGNLDARVRPGGSREVAQVAVLLNEMLDVRARTEAELRESEARYRLLIDKSPYTIGVHQDGKIVFINPSGVRLFGARSAAELIGLPIRDRVDPAHLDAAVDRIARMLKGESDLYPTEDRYVRLDGSRIEVEVTAAPFTHRGRPAIQVIALDITERKRAEEMLRESEERLRLALDAARMGTFDWDVAHNHITWSRWHEELWGFKPGEFDGTYEAFSQRVHPEDLPGVDAEVARCIAAREPFSREFRVLWPDGSLHWIGGQGQFMFDESGQPARMRGVVLETTARRQAEVALRESEGRYRNLFDNMLEGFAYCRMVFENDRPQDFVYVKVNTAFEKLTGLKNVVGKRVTEVIPGIRQSNPQLLESYGRVALTGKPEAFEMYLDALGTWFSVSAYSPEKEYFVAVFDNITERKRAEATRTQLAAIVQSSREAIIGTDLDGAITSWNPGAEHVYGYRAEEMIGWHISVLVPPERQAEPMALRDAFRRGEAVTDHETERVRKDGARIDVSLTLSPIRNEAGSTVGVSTIARDITEKKRAERSLRRVNRTLMMLSSCNEALVRATSEQQLLDDICRSVTEVGSYQLAWVGFARESPERTVSIVARAGTASAYLDELRFAWDDSPDGRSPTGTAIRRGERSYIKDFQTERRSGDWCHRASEFGLRSCVALPLAGKGCVVGALTLCSESSDILTDEEIGLLDELAADLAYGVLSLRAGGERDAAVAGHRASLEKTRKALEDGIQAIATAAEMRDAYTAGHQRRVADLSVAIAKEMGLPEEQVHGLHLAGVVHDIGKIQVPAEILSKPARLSALEFSLIQTHSQAGYDILKGIDFPWPIARIVLQHHERLDGGGYPQGLKAEAILLEARIIAVADTVEAMASHRPYRPGLGIDMALDEITKNRGRLYDPGAVDACVRLFREKRYAFS